MDMLHVTMRRVAEMLTARGVKVRPPSHDRTIQTLEALAGGQLSASARALFSTFDGFDDDVPDERTMICMWPVAKICEEIQLSGVTDKGIVVADYFLSADLVRCDLRSDEAPVWWQDRGTIAAANLLEFCSAVGTGTFAP